MYVCMYVCVNVCMYVCIFFIIFLFTIDSAQKIEVNKGGWFTLIVINVVCEEDNCENV